MAALACCEDCTRYRESGEDFTAVIDTASSLQSPFAYVIALSLVPAVICAWTLRMSRNWRTAAKHVRASILQWEYQWQRTREVMTRPVEQAAVKTSTTLDRQEMTVRIQGMASVAGSISWHKVRSDRIRSTSPLFEDNLSEARSHDCKVLSTVIASLSHCC